MLYIAPSGRLDCIVLSFQHVATIEYSHTCLWMVKMFFTTHVFVKTHTVAALSDSRALINGTCYTSTIIYLTYTTILFTC